MANKLTTAINKIFRVGTAPEGQARPTFGIGERGTVFSVPFGNGWERNLGGTPNSYNGTVDAVVSVLRRVLGASYPDHSRITEKGGREVVTTSAAHRLLMRPNAAQNAIDWVTYVVGCLCYYGNSYFYVQRNDRSEPIALIPLDASKHRAYFSDDSSAVFYDISNTGDFGLSKDTSKLVPARDVLHFKLPSRQSVLHGDSLISYAYGAIAINNAIQNSSATFLSNMNRPSGIISTEAVLTGAQMAELRTRFAEVSAGMNQGEIPILGNGLKWQPMGITANDAEVLATYNASVLDICRIFGVPIQLLGQETNGAASSVSALIGQFKAGSLLYFAELIEFGLEELFNFDHYKNTVRFDLDNVARADFATEVDTLAKAVQNSLFSPDEARNRLGNDSVPFGESPRTQAQNVRLEDAVPAPSAPVPSPTGQPSEEPEDDVPEETEDEVSKRLDILIKGYSNYV